MSLPKPDPSFEQHGSAESTPGIRKETDSSVGNTDDVHKVVAQCQEGEADGQRTLYDLFHRRVFRLAARMVGERDAADLTQDVFLRVFQKIDQFRGDSRFETWLHRISVNECLQLLRRRRKRDEKRLLGEPGGNSERPGERLERQDLLEQALAQLEPDVRSVFLLREVEGMDYAEIAEAAQIPEGTVGSRLNRARRRLREILTELGWEP